MTSRVPGDEIVSWRHASAPVHVWQSEVHERDVRPQSRAPRNGIPTQPGDTDHLYPVVGGEDQAQTFPNDLIVVGHEDPQREDVRQREGLPPAASQAKPACPCRDRAVNRCGFEADGRISVPGGR
jgi:hypothetical protein